MIVALYSVLRFYSTRNWHVKCVLVSALNFALCAESNTVLIVTGLIESFQNIQIALNFK